MNKKILVLSNMYPTDKHKTYGIFVKNQAEKLRERGADVTVSAIQDPGKGKTGVIKKYMGWLLRTFRVLVSRGKSYNIVHAHYVFPTGMLALMFKKLLKTPYVVTAHGGDIDRMAKKNARIRGWTRSILLHADHVIAVGEALRHDIIQDFDVPAERVTVMSMGVNRRIFQPVPKEEARAGLGIPSDEKPIVFVGNFIREKGVLDLIEAFSLLEKEETAVKLYMIGARRSQAFTEEAENLIKERGIRNIQFLDPVSQPELARWMAAAELFVLPSHMEGFGLVAVEAMACGTPVVGANVGGLSFLLADGSGVLAEPHNPVSLYESMAAILQDEALRERLLESGFRKAGENDEEKLMDKLEEIYGRIAK